MMMNGSVIIMCITGKNMGGLRFKEVVDAITEKGCSMEQQDAVYDIHFCSFIWST